jgi:spore germination protein
MLGVLVLGASTLAATPSPVPLSSASIGPSASMPLVAPSGGEEGANPTGGTELYGYLPYWEMTASMATYLAGVPLTSIELFSVTARKNGSLNDRLTGYRRITGSIGGRLISEAHARGQRVELVFSSFGFDRNAALFGSSTEAQIDHRWSANIDRPGPTRPTPAASRTAAELAALVGRLGVEGVNLDIEQIAAPSYDGYGAFVRDLRARLSALQPFQPSIRLSVATTAGQGGASLAGVAVAAGADRVFMMGYNYHWSGSQPGGSAPVARLDGGASLTSSIAIYRLAGVPLDRILLGLPLYGMAWPTDTSDRYAPSAGRGVAWLPSRHLAQLTAPGFVPHLDPLEVSEFISEPDASLWRAIFYDSPRTLREKLALARGAGYAGAGFWAIGYERDVPGYIELMGEFMRGQVAPAAAPLPAEVSDGAVCAPRCTVGASATSMSR